MLRHAGAKATNASDLQNYSRTNAIHMDFTLVIPTKNRPRFLKRLLNYCEETFPVMEIIVADSSDEEHLAACQEVCSRVKKHTLNRQVFRSDLPFIEKLVAATKLVKTSCMALLADDDLLLPGALEEALYQLRNDSQVVCVQGCEVIFRPATSLGRPDRLLMDFHGGRSLDMPSAAQRLIALMGQYRPTVYGVRRTADFLADLQSIVPMQSQYMLVELAFASLDVVRGKIVRLHRVLTMRESHGQVAYRQHSDVTYWEKILFAPGFSARLESYLNIVATQLKACTDLSEEQSRETVRESLREFTCWHFTQGDFALHSSSSMKVKLKSTMKEKLKSMIFQAPVVGPLLQSAWLVPAKAYDRFRLTQNFGEALRQPDFRELVARIESDFGCRRGSSIFQ